MVACDFSMQCVWRNIYRRILMVPVVYGVYDPLKWALDIGTLADETLFVKACFALCTLFDKQPYSNVNSLVCYDKPSNAASVLRHFFCEVSFSVKYYKKLLRGLGNPCFNINKQTNQTCLSHHTSSIQLTSITRKPNRSTADCNQKKSPFSPVP